MWIAAIAAASIHACMPVDGAQIYLRNLAQADSRFAAADPDLAAGFSPEPGSRRMFFPAELVRIAKGSGVPSDKLSESPFQPICFVRRSRFLKLDDLLPAIRAWAPDQATVEIADWVRTAVPEGDVVVPVPAITNWNSKAPILLHGYVVFDGHRHAPVWLRARITVRREAVVAREAIEPGMHVVDTQFQLTPLDFVNDWNAPQLTMDQVIGRVAKRRIPEGSAVTPADLKQPLPVEPRSNVTVEVLNGATHLEFEARAETGGGVGDMVTLRNASSGKLFSARVTGEGAVLVQPRGELRATRK